MKEWWKHLRAHFVSANNERDLAAPRIDETGPAGVNGDVLAISRTEADGGMVKGLTSILQNLNRKWGEWDERADKSNNI